MSDTTGENTFGLPSVPFVIDDSTEKLISRRPPRASTPKVNESKKSQSDHEEPCSSVQKLVSIKVTWAEHMNENTDPNVFDELTGNVEQYCQDQGFESQYDEIEWNIEFYDFVGPQDRVEGFICGKTSTRKRKEKNELCFLFSIFGVSVCPILCFKLSQQQQQ